MVVLFAGYLLKNGSLQTDKTMYDIVSDNWYLFYDYSIINSLDYFMELTESKSIKASDSIKVNLQSNYSFRAFIDQQVGIKVDFTNNGH